MKVWCGIDPRTKVCNMAGAGDDDFLKEITDAGYIAVPTTPEKARAVLFEVVQDIYSLTEAA